jgi:hypothetical protein
MTEDFTIPLWLLKLGALVNLYFLVDSLGFSPGSTDLHIVIPAQILFVVSAYRCLFPVRYEDNVVFHDVPLSSIFLTRLLATVTEVAFIYQFSRVIRLLNVDQVGWVDALSWLMVVQVVIAQGFVWAAIATRRLTLYFYEELGWAVIFAANTIASAYLCATVDLPGGGTSLLVLSMVFGALYLPWQAIHLRALRAEARSTTGAAAPASAATAHTVRNGLAESIHVRNRRTDAVSWGGLVGLTWMIGYWATLIPMWVNHVVGLLATR